MAFVLKTTFNNDTRRVLIDPVSGFGFRDLEALLVQQFPQAENFTVSYIDDEGDRVTITSDMELAEGFRLARQMGWKSLKIVVADSTARQATKQQVKQAAAAVVSPSTKEAEAARRQERPKEEPCHWGFVCDKSGQKPIVGARYHKVGENYDLCEAEFLKLPAEQQALFDKIDSPARGGWWRRFYRQQRGGDDARGRKPPPRGWRRHQRCGGGGRGRGRHWGCGGGRDGGNPLLRKAKKFFWMLRDSDIDPLLTALFEAGGAAAEACAPLKELAKAARDDVAMRVVKRMRRSPAVQKLKQKLKAVHEDVKSGRIVFFEAPAAVLNSEEWALAVAQMRDTLPAVAAAVEKMAELMPRLTTELPLLMPRLLPILMGMAFMGPPKKKRDRKKPQQRHQATFVKDMTVPDGSILAPKTVFTKTWTVTNSGPTAWPGDTALLHTGGDMELCPSAVRVAVGSVLPKEETQLSVDMTTPEKPGRFRSYWRLVAGDDPAAEPFGLRLWADVTVEEPKQAESSAPQEPTALQESTAPQEDGGASKDSHPTTSDGKMKGTEEPEPVAASKEAAVEAAAGSAEAQEEEEASTSYRVVKPQPPMMLGTALTAKVEYPEVPGPAASHRQPQPVQMPGLSPSLLGDSDGGTKEACGDETGDATIPSAVPAPAVQPSGGEEVNANFGPWKAAVETLVAMGFGPEQFQSLLKRHNGDIQAIIQELLQLQ